MCYLSWLGKSCLSKKGGFCTGGCLLKFHLININKHKIQNPHPSQQAHLPYPTFAFNSMTDRLQAETSHILTATDVMLHRSSWPFIYLLTMESFHKMPFWTPLVLKASGANTQGMTHLPTADASIKLLLPRSFLEHRWAMAESGGPTSPDVAMNFKHCRLFRLRHLSAKYKAFANKIPIRTTTYREARRHVSADCENRANFYLGTAPPAPRKRQISNSTSPGFCNEFPTRAAAQFRWPFGARCSVKRLSETLVPTHVIPGEHRESVVVPFLKRWFANRHKGQNRKIHQLERSKTVNTCCAKARWKT